MGHNPLGSGRLLIRPSRWAGSAPVARHGRTVHRQGTQGAGSVMSHNRGEATNANSASRSRTSHVKTHSLSSRVRRIYRGRAERAEDATGQVAFDATTDSLVRTTLGASLLHVLAGFAVMGHLDDRDHV